MQKFSTLCVAKGGLTYVGITSCVLFVSGEGGMFYAVFTTPPNAIPGSAVCKFSVKDLTDSFHQGGFKYQVSQVLFYKL
jgi:hypothetical protein